MKLNDVAKQYGRTVDEDGNICRDGVSSGVVARIVKGRLQCRNASSGALLFSGTGADSLEKFLERFWLLEKARS